MPNFHLHWLVAWKALDGISCAAAAGREKYLAEAERFRDGVHEDLAAIRNVADVEPFFSVRLPFRRRDWQTGLARSTQAIDEITCFSAFMLGACGPDFWTLTSRSGLGIVPDTASNHFDLGHYNRTHQQFRVSIERIGNGTGPQAQLERSYFLGMATHVAADLVLHQLVNVYAGAYNLLKKDNWNHEHKDELFDLWNTHNKVEHFWDSYVRYRYLGDVVSHGAGPVFEEDAPEWGEPLGFPLVETLVAKARAIELEPARQAVLARLVARNPARHRGKQAGAGGDEVRNDIRAILELPLVFPAVACDRILGEFFGMRPLAPFIYERVVHKQRGAYPTDHVFEAAVREANDRGRMSDDRTGSGLNEVRKLRYFSTAFNSNPRPHWSGQSYMNYMIAPDLARLQERAGNGALAHLQYGRNAFYDLSAIKQFGEKAVAVAKSFATALDAAYTARNPDGLGDLARFWNLDTGLGFEVQNVASHTDRELITRLDFVHVFDERLGAAGGTALDPGHRRSGDASKIPHLAGKAPRADDFSNVAERAFPVRSPAPGPFEALSAVTEPDATAYLDRIRLTWPPARKLRDLEVKQPAENASDPPSVRQENRTRAWLDAFFASSESPRTWRHPFGTVGESATRRFELQPVKHRLTLELRVPIADIGGGGDVEPAMLFYCDRKLGLADACTKAPRDWLSSDKLVDYSTTPVSQGPLRVFTARILVNVEEESERVVELGRWNNVVPYGDSKKFYGRNFAIATGRRFVLCPRGGGLFDPTVDFEYQANVTPTEHVFFTLYVLVKTPTGVMDALSKENVTRAQFDQQLRRITALEWRKVILCYDLHAGDAVQLPRCFVDGLDVTPVGADA